jgi:hypothetical protein
MTVLIKADSQYLPETFDDMRLVAHLQTMWTEADKKRTYRKRMFYLCAALFVITFASFVVRLEKKQAWPHLSYQAEKSGKLGNR